MRRATLCVVIPAFNEEKVIESSLINLKGIIGSKHIYVVSDGSKDKTARIARSCFVNVMNLRRNVGKAAAVKKLIDGRQITKRYQYVLFSDADSCLDNNFIREIKPFLHQKVALLLGTVSSQRKGLVSAFRTYEYALGHLVYKRAQNTIGLVTVAPGCASLYSSRALEKIDFSHHTLTEDFDLTIQIHQKKLGQIIYVSKAVAYTQDPLNIVDYWRQIVRWYIGTWQNIFLHKLYKPDAKFNLEIYFLMLDNVLILFTIWFFIFHPIFLIRFSEMLFLTIIFTSFIVALIQKKLWITIYAPLFPAFYAINICAFYWALFKAIIGRNRVYGWAKIERYSH